MTAVAVGAGHRTIVYASYALQHPDELKVGGVVDPNDLRRRRFAETHRIPAENQFASVEDLVKRPQMADAAINGTMDHLHVATSLPLLRAGYHLLLEKPVATSAAANSGRSGSAAGGTLCIGASLPR